MNTLDLTFLLEYPEQINSEQTTELESILLNFPYFQPARAIYLKGLYNQNSYKYNAELKISAAYTTNRTLLFHFITSPIFKNFSAISSTEKKENGPVIPSTKNTEIATEEVNASAIERSILKSIAQTTPNSSKNIINWEPNVNMVEPEKNNTFVDNGTQIKDLENKKIIEFDRHESHTFTQWLQLTKITPIDRSVQTNVNSENLIENESKPNKFELIDKFIETNPKIGAAKPAIAPVNIEKSNQENSSLMTETLAKIYLDQKKYLKAIQAYEILILKYPEKSSLFAERIIEIKKIQNNNN